ncbi:MAG: TRAP transporter large permease subunit [Spirochaetaceae bacterium]|jgi:tripartite ATP-independent transporter DctM subunit|nr:TRAP transporter large permease subunit [Spirochaetaceae bacterium]
MEAMEAEVTEKRPSGLGLLENTLCYLSLALLAALPVSEMAARLVFKTSIPASFETMNHLLLMVGLLSGMAATSRGEHLSIGLAQNFFPQKVKNRVALGNSLLAALILTVIAFTGVSFAAIGLSPPRMIGLIPNRTFALIIPVGYAVMAARFALAAPVKGWKRLFPALAITAGIVFSFPMVAKALWGFNLPDWAYALTERYFDLAYYAKAPAVLLLLAAALAGAPLFVVLGGLSLILIQAAGGEIDVVANQVYTTLTKDSFIAIPLFTLTGFFLSESKAGERLVETFRSLFSWLPGGMIAATVVICAFFTSFTGASGVTVLALGGILHTILKDAGYKDRFSIGLLTSVGSIGLLFPPSIPIILVGTASMTNIFHVFLGGIVPGILLVSAVVAFGVAASVKTKIPVEPFNLKRAGAALKRAGFEIALPFLLIAGYFSGILTIIEIGAVAVAYIFIVEVCIHRDLGLKDVPKVFAKAVPIIGGVLSILALSQALSYYIVDTQAPENLVRWMQGAVHSKYVFLLLLNLALLAVGCLMDIFSAILIVLPLVIPVGLAYGIEPAHLGIIFITNLEVGFLTPPVGMNLFLAAYRFNTPFIKICRYVFPFMLIQLAVVILVTYLPQLSLFLIGLLG